jgi:hypothetical protein
MSHESSGRRVRAGKAAPAADTSKFGGSRPTMRHRVRLLLILAFVCAAGLLVYSLLFRTEPPVAEQIAAPVDSSLTAAADVPTARAEHAPEPAPVRECTGQTVRLVRGSEMDEICVGDTRMVQNGSVRVYEVHALAGPPRWLRIEAMGRTVLSVAFGGATEPRLRCEQTHCRGIVIGRHDVEGVRTISLKDVALFEVRAGRSLSPDPVAAVSATLKTLPEDRVPALACTGQGVSIVTSDGSVSTFCPHGGAGYEIVAGTRRYRFTNLDGASILVSVDSDHRPKRVEYEGDDALVCAAGCRVRVSGPNAGGERIFTFEGTTLLETGMGQRNAILNGTLIVPSL